MSKIGKQPIKIPEGVTVELSEREIKIKGSKDQVLTKIPAGVKAALENGELTFTALNNSKQSRSNWGTIRSLVNNSIFGLTKGFEKNLILEGVGYKVLKEGNDLVLNIGFSHPVRYSSPPGISFEVEKNSLLKIKGIDKALVGQVAAEIRALKKPEPYKGKGFHYSGEVVRRKAGKKAVAAGSA